MSFLTLKALFQEMLTIAEAWWLNIFDNNQQVILFLNLEDNLKRSPNIVWREEHELIAIHEN